MESITDLDEANRCVRELAALTLLPAIWSGGQPHQIRESLADGLQSAVRPDLVFVTAASGSSENPGSSTLRTKGIPCTPQLEERLLETIHAILREGGSDLVTFRINDQAMNLAVIPLGPSREFGVVAVGCKRSSFPNTTERILLNVAVNQAIVALRSARQVAALHRSEGELRDFFENATVGLHWVDPDGIIVWANKTELKLLGYAREEYVGHNICDFHADGCVIQDILTRLTRGETLHEYEAALRCKDGTLRHVLIDSNALFENGKFIHTRCFTRDVTERKRIASELDAAQDELRRHADKLEKQVAERTVRLQETIHELEAFSYSVSHDMRSPLRAMQGYAAALMEDYKGRLDETGEDYLKRIHRGASRMDLLIQDVLAYSRLSKEQIRLEPMKVEPVIADAIQNYPALQPERATIAMRSAIPLVLGHPAYLTQIVSNLLTNGVKFTPPGVRPEIGICAQPEGDMVRLIFSDNGIGIAPEHQKQIFQIFGRVYSDKKYEGTGIGLAIVKKAAERMGGSVGVQSELGHGSQFFVLLKRAI